MTDGQHFKILFVITQGEWGGAQRYVFDLATNLGSETAVVIGEKHSELGTRLAKSGIKTFAAGHLRRDINPLHDLLAIFELKRIFQNIRPDIVHLNSSKAGVLGSIAAHLAGVPKVIFTAHGFAFLEPQPWIMKQIYYFAERFACLFRDKIICVSEYDRQAAIKAKLCPAEKLVTIHNGIRLQKSDVRSQSSDNRNQTSAIRPPSSDLRVPIIGTIAHLYKTKGLNYLIDAARSIDAQFMVIGDGPERNNLESLIAKYNLGNKIKILGAKENAADYLPQFDIFVLPSVKEGFPYAILEAMAAGLPIVATPVGGIPEAQGDAGILVPPKDSKALATAIQSLIDDPKRAKKMGLAAHERIKQFSFEKMLEETIKIYKTTAD